MAVKVGAGMIRYQGQHTSFHCRFTDQRDTLYTWYEIRSVESAMEKSSNFM